MKNVILTTGTGIDLGRSFRNKCFFNKDKDSCTTYLVGDQKTFNSEDGLKFSPFADLKHHWGEMNFKGSLEKTHNLLQI